MTRGIRQGCPLSAFLFLFVAEILGTKLETNENIFGIRINDYEIRNIQHADDLTITVQDENSLSQALNTVHEFCKHAGSKININKTECILLGPLKDAYDEILGIKVTNKAVKCLGIYIGHDKEECYNKNWMKIYHDMEKLFESWKKRKLTLFGKTCVINTLAISKLIYTATILCLPTEEYVKKTQRLIFNFIWNKTERIKRNTLIGNISDGGLAIMDIDSKLKALKAAWVPRLLNSNSTISKIFKGILLNLNKTIHSLTYYNFQRKAQISCRG